MPTKSVGTYAAPAPPLRNEVAAAAIRANGPSLTAEWTGCMVFAHDEIEMGDTVRI